MTADEVLATLGTLSRTGVDTWLDGGWGVDALVGQLTRSHPDLDVVVRCTP